MATRRKRRLGTRAREHLMKRANTLPCSASNPLREADRRAAAEANRRVEQRKARRALGAGGERRVAVFALVGAEPLDHFGQLGVVAVLLEPGELAGVMAIDLFFDGSGAGHRRLGPDQRRGGSERVAGG